MTTVPRIVLQNGMTNITKPDETTSLREGESVNDIK